LSAGRTSAITSSTPLHGRLAVLGPLDEPGQLGQMRGGADPGRFHDQPAAGVDGRADDGVARADLRRHRLAGEHRPVDRRRALDDDAVRGELLSRPYDEPLADRQPLDRHPLLAAVAQHRHVLGAQLEQGPNGGAGPSLGARLEVATGEDQRRDPGRHLQAQPGKCSAGIIEIATTGAARARLTKSRGLSWPARGSGFALAVHPARSTVSISRAKGTPTIPHTPWGLYWGHG
jgi:hypothetical protein